MLIRKGNTMKAITNCKACREKMLNQAREEYLKKQYAIYQDLAHTFACYCTAAVLMAFARKGRTKKYIQELFNDLVFIFDTGEIFGKAVTLTDVLKQLEKDYDIDFKRLNVHIETEKEFITGMKKGR